MIKPTERKEWVDLLDTINQIEIKGQKNIFFMYNTIAFLQSKITEIDKENMKENTKEQGG